MNKAATQKPSLFMMAKKEPEYRLHLNTNNFLLHKQNLQKKLDKYEEEFAKKLKEISIHQKVLSSSLSSESESSSTAREGASKEQRDGNFTPRILRKSNSQIIDRRNSTASSRNEERKVSEVRVPSKASSFPEQIDYSTTALNQQSTNFENFVQNKLEIPRRQRKVLRRQQRIDSIDLHVNRPVSSSLQLLSVSDFVNDQKDKQVLSKSQQLHQDGKSIESARLLRKTETSKKNSTEELEKEEEKSLFGNINTRSTFQCSGNAELDEASETIVAEGKERLEMRTSLSKNANFAARSLSCTETSESNYSIDTREIETEKEEIKERLFSETTQTSAQRFTLNKNSEATKAKTESIEVKEPLFRNTNITHARSRLVNTEPNKTNSDVKTNDDTEKEQMKQRLLRSTASSQAAGKLANTKIIEKTSLNEEGKLEDEAAKTDKYKTEREQKGRLFRNSSPVSLLSRPKVNNSFTTYLHAQTINKKTHIKSVNDISRTTLERPISLKLTRNSRSLSPVFAQDKTELAQNRHRSKTFSGSILMSKESESKQDFVVRERQVPKATKDTLTKEKSQYLYGYHSDAWCEPNEAVGDQEHITQEVSIYQNNSQKQSMQHKMTGVVSNKAHYLRENNVTERKKYLDVNNKNEYLLSGNNSCNQNVNSKKEKETQSTLKINKKDNSLFQKNVREGNARKSENQHFSVAKKDDSSLSNERALQDNQLLSVKKHQEARRANQHHKASDDSQKIIHENIHISAEQLSINQSDNLITEKLENTSNTDRLSSDHNHGGQSARLDYGHSEERISDNGQHTQANQKLDTKRAFSTNQSSEEKLDLDSVFSYSSTELQENVSTTTNQSGEHKSDDVDCLSISTSSELAREESPTLANQNIKISVKGPVSKGWRKLQGVPLARLTQLSHVQKRDSSSEEQKTLTGFKDQSSNTGPGLMSFRQVVMAALKREQERKLELERQKHLQRKERINEIQQPTESFMRQTMDKAVYHGYVPRPPSDQPQGAVKFRTVVTSLQGFRNLGETVSGNRLKRAERIRKRSNPAPPYTRKLELLTQEHKTDEERMRDVKGCRYLRVKNTLP